MSECEGMLDLLRRLNELEQRSGRVPAERDPNYDPSGEANARIQLLKQDLQQLGAALHWNGREHHLADPVLVLELLPGCRMAGKPAGDLSPLLGHLACPPGGDAAVTGPEEGADDSAFVLRFPSEQADQSAFVVRLRIQGRVSRDRLLQVLRGEPVQEASNVVLEIGASIPGNAFPGEQPGGPGNP